MNPRKKIGKRHHRNHQTKNLNELFPNIQNSIEQSNTHCTAIENASDVGTSCLMTETLHRTMWTKRVDSECLYILAWITAIHGSVCKRRSDAFNNGRTTTTTHSSSSSRSSKNIQKCHESLWIVWFGLFHLSLYILA